MIGKKVTVILSEVVEAIGTQGTVNKTWKDLTFLTGALLPKSSSKTFADGKWKVYADYTFTCEKPMPYDVDEKHIIRYGKRSFDIVGKDDYMDQSDILVLTLKERT